MADNKVTIESHYLKYSTKAEVEALLEEVESSSTATEQSVRSIVTDYQH